MKLGEVSLSQVKSSQTERSWTFGLAPSILFQQEGQQGKADLALVVTFARETWLSFRRHESELPDGTVWWLGPFFFSPLPLPLPLSPPPPTFLFYFCFFYFISFFGCLFFFFFSSSFSSFSSSLLPSAPVLLHLLLFLFPPTPSPFYTAAAVAAAALVPSTDSRGGGGRGGVGGMGGRDIGERILNVPPPFFVFFSVCFENLPWKQSLSVVGIVHARYAIAEDKEVRIFRASMVERMH